VNLEGIRNFLGYLTLAVLVANEARALTLEAAITYVIETHPEISAAEANKQAIEFELEQARGFRTPRVSLEAWSGYSQNRGNSIPDAGASDSTLGGYDMSARISQMIFDGSETRSEIEHQAYRIDSAAMRVLERSEVLALEAVRLYSDVLRASALLKLAQDNLAYHQEVFGRLENGFRRGVIGVSDVRQAEERVLLAEDTILDFELNLEDTKTLFLATVGIEAKQLHNVPNIGGSMPHSLEAALKTTRNESPVIKLSQSDVGSAEALMRRVNSNALPTLSLEAEARFGENIGGFEGRRQDASVGLMLRYEFQGKTKRAAREEQIRRVSESRARLLARTRKVEAEVRQSWATLQSANRRLKTIEAQAKLSRELRESYEVEFTVGSRSLLDVLNTQSALFQAEANLINARSLSTYARYRLLASIGKLLPTLGIAPPEDAQAYASEFVGAPGLSETSPEGISDARAFKDWRKSLGQNGN
jgi:adhesin transport system outer membrane protein